MQSSLNPQIKIKSVGHPVPALDDESDSVVEQKRKASYKRTLSDLVEKKTT